MASIKKTALSSVSKVLRSIKDTMEAKKKATRTRKQVKGISDKAQELENTRPSYSRHPLGSTTDYDKSITGQRKGGVHQEVAEFDQQLTTSDALIDRNVNALIDLKKSAKNILDTINNTQYKFFKRAKENGELYGSLKPMELSNAIENLYKVKISPSQIDLVSEIKKIGSYTANINLHAEIQAKILIEVAKQEDEK